jgi:glycerol-3-phosphate acyltransferase PlsX
MGGDYAPQNPVAGAVDAARQFGIKTILVGDEEKIRSELTRYDTAGLALEIVHASEYVRMDETTLDAMRSKRDSSIRVASRLVKEGKAHGLVSAGHTGAAMAISKIICGSLDRVKRPALALAAPTLAGNPTVFLDVGANVTCKSQHLVQFAIMGNTYARDVLHIENPRVGVLSNGEEATKGNEVVKKTVERLSRTKLNFIGPVEGRDLFNGNCDVMVTDGFTGNAVLKAAESIAELTFKVLKEEIMSSWINKLAAMILRRSFKNLKRKFDYSEYGGAPLLGIKGVCIICHGRSNPEAIKNAIRVAAEFYENDANTHIQKGISDLYKEQIL